MRKRWVLPALALMVAVAWAGLPPLAQAEGAGPELSEDVRGIHQALDRLVELLEVAEHDRRVELLIKRIEILERRLSPQQSRLRSAQHEVDGLQDEVTHLEGLREQREDAVQNEIRSGADPAAGTARRELEEVEHVLASIEERLEAAISRVRQYEDEIAEGREAIEILDERLLELLEDD